MIEPVPTDTLAKGYTSGTHRLVTPEQTLATITPHLTAAGITRCADVTNLDCLGIPVYCAVRPRGIFLQVSNGKGLSHAAAKVSALMEAIELFHIEHPKAHFERTSLQAMQRDSKRVIHPAVLPEYRAQQYFCDDYMIHWLRAEDLLSGEKLWLPASAVHRCPVNICGASTNGLASGNHLVEATLHALYEVIERDAIARLSVEGRLNFKDGRCRFIDLMTVSDDSVRGLHEKLYHAGVKLVLIWIQSCIPIHTFMAVLLDSHAFSHSSTVNLGYGTHLSVAVAAVRAITEAAQSRLTFIHGSREDLGPQAYQNAHRKLYNYFDARESDTKWATLEDMSGSNLRQDSDQVLSRLVAAGYNDIFRVDMTRAPFDIPMAKVFIPGLKLNKRLV